MRFRQLDQITEVKPGVSLAARRTLSEKEYYLRDHFPQFPIMPGVMILETMFQAASWLVRKTDDFAHSVVLLKEVRNVKFAGLVRPGQTLTVSATIKKHESQLTTLMVEGAVDGVTVASGRLVLERFNLTDRYPVHGPTDAYLQKKIRETWSVLTATPAVPVVPSGFRWMWIDRFREFVSGRRSVAVKAVSIVDEPIDLYMPGFPVMPCSLILEGIAVTGGILVGECHAFQKRIVLAKVTKAVFHRPAFPGDVMVYSTEIENLQPEGAAIRGTSRIGDELHGEVEMFFAFLPERIIEIDLIPPAEIMAMLRMYGLFDVAGREDGSPLEIDPRLLRAEHEANTNPLAITR
jgi:3-hydroxyacyl-[acyl-carrier-protein] dehydratase